MPLVEVIDWTFETLDYTKYHHIINQDRIIWFGTNYNFSSEYILPSQRSLDLTTFCSKNLTLNGNEIIAILMFCRFTKNKITYCLEIFPDAEKNWEFFSTMFDLFISLDLTGNKALRQLYPFVNTLKY